MGRSWFFCIFSVLKNVIYVLVIMTCTVQGNPTCSKQWIRYMVVNACSYAKRGLVENNFFIETTNEEIERLFNKLSLFDDDNEWQRKYYHYDKIHTQLVMDKDRRNLLADSPDIHHENMNNREFWESFVNYAQWLFSLFESRHKRSANSELNMQLDSAEEIVGIPIAWLNKDELNEGRIDKRLIRRNIRRLVEKCCTKLCTVDDFKDICG